MQSFPFFISFLQHCLARRSSRSSCAQLAAHPPPAERDHCQNKTLQPNPLFTFLWILQLLSRGAAFEVIQQTKALMSPIKTASQKHPFVSCLEPELSVSIQLRSSNICFERIYRTGREGSTSDFWLKIISHSAAIVLTGAHDFCLFLKHMLLNKNTAQMLKRTRYWSYMAERLPQPCKLPIYQRWVTDLTWVDSTHGKSVGDWKNIFKQQH